MSSQGVSNCIQLSGHATCFYGFWSGAGPVEGLPLPVNGRFNGLSPNTAHVALQEDRDMRTQTSIRQARPG